MGGGTGFDVTGFVVGFGMGNRVLKSLRVDARFAKFAGIPSLHAAMIVFETTLGLTFPGRAVCRAFRPAASNFLSAVPVPI